MSPKTDPQEQREESVVKRATLLIVLLICALSVACSKTPNKNQTNNSQAQTSTTNSASSTAAPSELSASAPTEDKGDFKLSYVPVKDEELAHIEKVVKDSKLFERLIDQLNNVAVRVCHVHDLTSVAKAPDRRPI